MSAGIPAPLVPAEVDLRDFAFMPLDVVRLRDSGLTAKASGDEFRAAVLLWCASWHQVPAASLPDDDDELANICGYSRSRREWIKVRAGARRGWVACSDGRLYHEAVAGKALEAWIEKLASAIGGAVGNAKRWNVAIDTGRLRAQFGEAVDALRCLDPQSRTLRKKAVAVLTAPSPPDSPPDTPPESPPDSHPDRKGQGQGQGQGLEKDMVAPAVAAPTEPPPAPPLKAKDLQAEGVDPQKAADWLALRKAKRLPLTPSAWADTKAEGLKAGMTPPQAVATAVANNWAGFKAVWLLRDAAGKPAMKTGDVFEGAH
jgi:hypothetical protein